MTNTTAPAAAAIIVDVKNDDAARAIVATIRKSARTADDYAAYVAAHGVTRGNVAAHADALARAAFPKFKAKTDEVDGKRVRNELGRAYDAAAKGLKACLPKADTKPVDVLAALTKAATKAVEGGFTGEEIAAALHAAGLTSVDATALAVAVADAKVALAA